MDLQTVSAEDLQRCKNVKTDFLLFKFLLLTALLKYNLHNMELIHFKHGIQLLLGNLQNFAISTPIELLFEV